MDRGRHFILIFALVGVFLVLVQRLIFHLLIPYTKAGAILQPAIPITPPRFYAAQLVGLALFLAPSPQVSGLCWALPRRHGRATAGPGPSAHTICFIRHSFSSLRLCDRIPSLVDGDSSSASA